MNRQSRARALRALIQRSGRELPDEALTGLPAGAFDPWRAGETYQPGQVVAHGQRLYRVIQGHDSQEDWPPDQTPALFGALGVPPDQPEAVPEWSQPYGAHDAYRAGDRVRYQNRIWRSQVDANIFAPGVVPGQWTPED